MKKLIISLSSIMGITLTASAVVSCGISFNSLLQRKVDTNEFKAFFKANPYSLVSAKTMQASDFELISDLSVPLVSADQFGRTIGELAVKYSPAYTDDFGDYHPGDQFVGKRIPESEGKPETWTYLINKKAQWTNSRNSDLGKEFKIKGTDFLNIFLYVAHPNTASDVKTFWTSYIAGADQLINYIDNGAGSNDNRSSIERYGMVYRAIDGIRNLNNGSFDGMKSFIVDRIPFILGVTAGTVNDLDKDSLTGHPGISEGMISLDDETYFVRFTGPDNMPMPFFDSLMSYASFAPLPNIAVDLSESASGSSFSNYMTTDNFERTALYSGPFVIKKLQLSQSIEYEKNKFYANKDDVKFEKLTRTFKAQSTDADLRTSFESGDLSELVLKPTDPQGWKTYIGQRLENPNFDGITVEESKSQASLGIYMNVINTNLWTPTPTADAELNTRVLSSDIIRKYLMTAIQRSWVAKYYSSAFDKAGERHISATSINTLTPTNFVFNGEKDYIEYIAEEIGRDNVITDSLFSEDEEVQKIFEQLKPGGDFYSHHNNVSKNEVGGDVPLGYQIMRDITDVDKFDEQNEQYLQGVRNEVERLLKDTGTNKVTLSQLTNGATSNTVNINIQNMIDIFNKTAKDEGIKINIVQDQTNDQSEFLSKRVQSAYDLIITGWSPDFTDPVTYLNTHKINGDLANYFGLHRIIDASKTSDIMKKWREQKDFTYDELEKEGLLNTAYITSDKLTQEQMVSFVKDIAEYTYLVEEGSSTSDLDSRYRQLAKAEKLFLIDKSLMIPVYDPFVLPSVKMSFVKPYSYSTVGYGSSKYLHRGWEILPQLPTRNGGIITKIEEAYNKYMLDIPNSGIKLATLNDKYSDYLE